MLPVPPHFFGLAQRNGVEPQRKALGWWRPREVSGPTRLSHSRGRCHSAAKVSASRTDCITRPRGEGLGSDVDWRLKVFCPAFLQKSGRGPGRSPGARQFAPMLTKRRRGSKGEPSPGVPPLRAAPAARSPCDLRTSAVIRRRAGMEPRPYRGLAERGKVGGGRTFGSSRTPTPTAGGKRAVCRVIYCNIITRPGGGRRNAVTPAETEQRDVGDAVPYRAAATTWGRRSSSRRAGVEPRPYEGVAERGEAGGECREGRPHRCAIKTKTPPGGRHFSGVRRSRNPLRARGRAASRTRGRQALRARTPRGSLGVVWPPNSHATMSKRNSPMLPQFRPPIMASMSAMRSIIMPRSLLFYLTSSFSLPEAVRKYSFDKTSAPSTAFALAMPAVLRYSFITAYPIADPPSAAGHHPRGPGSYLYPTTLFWRTVPTVRRLFL